jgi:hypothetical protein
MAVSKATVIILMLLNDFHVAFEHRRQERRQEKGLQIANIFLLRNAQR